MKNLEILKNEFDLATDATFQEILGDNEHIDVTTLTNNEKWCMIVYRELAEALKGKNRELVLDANYERSRMHNKTEAQLAKGQCNQWLVDYFRVVSDDRKSLMGVYTKDVRYDKGTIAFAVSTSSKELTRNQIAAMEDDLHFIIEYKKDGTPKAPHKERISYEGLPEVVQTICAILESTEAELQRRRDEKKTAKKKAEPEVAEAPAAEEKEPEIVVAEPKKTTKKRRTKKATPVA